MKKLLLATICLLFLILCSWNIASYIVHAKYYQSNEINGEMESIMQLIKDNPEAYSRLETVNEDIKFINAFCFEGVQE